MGLLRPSPKGFTSEPSSSLLQPGRCRRALPFYSNKFRRKFTYESWRQADERLQEGRCGASKAKQAGDQATAQADNSVLLPIRIRTQHGVSFGEIIRVVGAGQALGNWNPDRAPGMTWSEGNEWVVELEVDPGEYDFKCVVTRADGSIAAWEPGENRTLKVPELPENYSKQVMEVICPWSNTTATFMSFDEDDATARLESSPQGEAVLAADDSPHSGGNPALSSRDNDGEGLAMLDVGAIEDTTSVEEKVDAVAKAIQNNSIYPQDSLDAEDTSEDSEEFQALASSEIKGGNGARPAEAIVHSQRETEQAEDTPAATSLPVETIKDDNLQVISNPANRRPTDGNHSQLKEVQKSSDVPSPSPPSDPIQEPAGTFIQGVAGILGFVAIPFVLWSEYTLKQTGCGLPPGPSGYLGAAEGISYLTVVGLAVAGLLSKATKGRGLPRGPAGLLGAAEGLSYAAILAGTFVLGFQYKDYGYIPSALPDSKCYGPEAPNSSSQLSLPSFPTKIALPSLPSKISLPSLPSHIPLPSLPSEVSLPSLPSEITLPFFSPSVQRPVSDEATNLQMNSVSDLAEADQSENGDNSVSEKFKGTIRNAQRIFMSDPNSEMEYLTSGAEDGLSSAELEPVVEELEDAAVRIGSLFNMWRERLSGAANSSSAPQQPSGLSKELSLATYRSKDPTNQHLDVAQVSTGLQDPNCRLVGMELGFTVAANNAATAANIATENLQNEIIKLESATSRIQDSVQDLAESVTQQTEAEAAGLNEVESKVTTGIAETAETAEADNPFQPSLSSTIDQPKATPTSLNEDKTLA